MREAIVVRPFVVSLVAALAMLAAETHATPPEPPLQTPATIPWERMIGCEVTFEEYQSFVLGDLQSADFKRRMNIRKVEQSNSFLSEYELPKAIQVFGYSTRRVVFTSSGIMAVLEESDSKSLAAKLELPVTMSFGPKILATRVLKETSPEIVAGMQTWKKVSRDLSTVTSHPGKTLVGCTYRLEMKD